jgi:ubiquinone/menaquinone biosynthesis C-methylase UbiE
VGYVGEVEKKPAHLGRTYADQFKEDAVVRAYRHRPPYVQEAVDHVVARLPQRDGRVLDIGCGSGDWTLALAACGIRVDAVDASAAMLDVARGRTGTDSPHVHWLHGDVETVALEPTYDLVTAAESLHWMEWSVALPRLRSVLARGGSLVLVNRIAAPPPWTAPMQRLIAAHSTNSDYSPYDLVDELARRGLFRETERHETAAVPFEQSVEDYVESFHSRNGFSRARMSEGSAADFDRRLAALVRLHVGAGPVVISNSCRLVFGVPLDGRG